MEIPATIRGMPGLYTDALDRQVEAEELFADLIEQAFMTGQITGEAQALAYL